jgi:hypothetical protein
MVTGSYLIRGSGEDIIQATILFKDAPKPAPSASRPGRGPFDLGVGAPFLFSFQLFTIYMDN